MARQVITIPTLGSSFINNTNSNFQQLFDANPSLSDHDYEFIAIGNDGINQDGNWRLRISDGDRFVVERYDSAQVPQWIEVSEFGASITVDKVYLLAGLGAMGIVTSDNVYNIGRQTQNIDAIDLGDLEWPTILSSSAEIKRLISDGTTVEDIAVQPLSDEANTATTLLEFPLVGTTYSKIKTIKVLYLDATDDIRYVVRRGDENGLIINESKPEADFNLNVNQQAITVGENTIELGNNPIYTSPGVTQWVQVYTKQAVRSQGHTTNIEGTDRFQPRILVDAVIGTSETVATREWVNGRMGNQLELSGFSIDIPSRVDVDTDLNVSATMDYSVVGFSDITELKLQINNVDIATLTNPTSDGAQSETITLSGIDTSNPTTLNFRLQANGMDNSNVQVVTVRNLQPHEFIYYGIGNIDPTTVDVSTLQSQEVIGSGSFQVSLGPSTLGQDIVFLTPFDRDITSIVNQSLNINVRPSFTRVESDRQINSVNYNSYELDNINEGLTFNYTITHS